MNSSRQTCRTVRGFTLIELLLVIALIGGAIWGVSKWRGNKAKAKAAKEEAAKPVTVKGFYIGMSTNELRPIIESDFDKNWSFGNAVDKHDWLMLTKMGEPKPGDGGAMFREEKQISFQYDGDRVTTIFFNKYASDAVFDSANQGAKEFCQNFVDAYGTSPLKADGTAWTYNGKGVKVRVSTDKEILIEQFSAQAARSKFN